MNRNSRKWQLDIELVNMSIDLDFNDLRSANSGSDLSRVVQWMNSWERFSKCICTFFSISIFILSPNNWDTNYLTLLLCVAPQKVMYESDLFKKYSFKYVNF